MFKFKKIGKKLLPLIFVCIILETTAGQSTKGVKALYEQLLTGYKKQIFPVTDPSKPLNVQLSFWLKSITDFDVVNENLAITAAIELIWKDPSLTWDPALFGDSSVLRIPSSDIWIPWLYLLNSVDEIEPIGRDADFLTTLHFDGTVKDLPGAILNSNCPTDMSKFPFDIQTCILKLVMWNAASAYNLSSTSDRPFMEYFSPNPHWKFVDGKALIVEQNNMQIYQIEISLQRNPLYYTLLIILPTFILCLLNPLVFVFPIEAGERMGLSISIFLAFAFFLTIVANVMPASSNPLCFLLVIMLLIISNSGMIVVGVIITTRYFYHQNLSQDFKVEKIVSICTGLGRDEDGNVKISGKEIAIKLDKFFMTISYVLVFILMAMFYFYVSH